MTTIHKRTMVTLPTEVKQALDALAKKQEKSVSKTAADLLIFALNIQEDLYLDTLAHNRISESYTTIAHDDIWK